MKTEIVLCDLVCGDRRMTTWLDKHPKLKEGVYVTLVDNTKDKWLVRQIYHSMRPHHWGDFDFHRKWTNNNFDHHEGLKIGG